ncbi:3-isopropylmalate/(R)-2-methylmalate dehydratase small subunit [Enterococcus sp. PF1-24]|uniref:3-isopropylmalate dehydratase small subunit n=1 Tax=unclassified Enterococcus TaxID=2608891 RepID=UPI002475D35C|nr:MULTISPECIES: 3-isopropylmalate dehydratase small subunit [unclassified Enterococcus]MDH6365737.1 3-isopropylmalate/(R)-2-methylmalate dehydratase small subunit [Enterococcus sp. PFB1-1]MDH6402840.1 3-isopropylmalate/(R)-2-methylmalate dehydratase small subunit [Enterococcus sp. PF1-24]
MEKFTIHQGQSVPLMNDNIDTDQIIPKSYLKGISKTGFGEFLFDDWRYQADRLLNMDFRLNEPAYQGATILISGDNFGSGSSREHAAWALLDYGFKAVIAGSYSDIFYMNATKNGLLPIVLPLAERQKLAALPADNQVVIDLPNQVVQANGESYSFEIDVTWKEKLVNGLDDIGITMTYEEQITAYEKKIPAYWQS